MTDDAMITPEARELAELVKIDEDRHKAFHAMVTRKIPLLTNALSQVVAVAVEHEREHRKVGIFSPADIFGACVLLATQEPV